MRYRTAKPTKARRRRHASRVTRDARASHRNHRDTRGTRNGHPTREVNWGGGRTRSSSSHRRVVSRPMGRVDWLMKSNLFPNLPSFAFLAGDVVTSGCFLGPLLPFRACLQGGSGCRDWNRFHRYFRALHRTVTDRRTFLRKGIFPRQLVGTRRQKRHIDDIGTLRLRRCRHARRLFACFSSDATFQKSIWTLQTAKKHRKRDRSFHFASNFVSLPIFWRPRRLR